MAQPTSTVAITDRVTGDEVDGYFQVTAQAVNGPWLILTHDDGATTMIQVDPAHRVTVTPDAA